MKIGLSGTAPIIGQGKRTIRELKVASSTGRCNTLQYIDWTMLPLEGSSVWLYFGQNLVRVVFRPISACERFQPLFSLQIGFEISVASTH